MPKIKTSRIAKKKFRVGGTGTIKKAQTNTSHNTGKKSSKRMRRLRKRNGVNSRDLGAVERMLLVQ